MLQTEFIKNLNCNYERIMLDEKPEENRYQYCIVTRGGMKGILPCSLRYINGVAYLYYDISSTQSVEQLYSGRNINRQWIKDFLWGMRRIYREMDRFLLDNQNLLWFPNQIFQDLEKKDFYFVYIPYYNDNTGFLELLDYLVEHIDYEDDALVECVYKMHEQYEALGDAYLAEQIFEDSKRLEEEPDNKMQVTEKVKITQQETFEARNNELIPEKYQAQAEQENRKGIRYFFEGRLKKQRSERDNFYQSSGTVLAGAVCEELGYEYPQQGIVENEKYVEDIPEEETAETEEIGKTIYMEIENEDREKNRGLYSADGKTLFKLDKQSVILGKKKEEADFILDDISVSRMHARISRQKDGYYLEDLNSTNGTSKNGLRLQPYEKRMLESGDEIKLGKVIMIFR